MKTMAFKDINMEIGKNVINYIPVTYDTDLMQHLPYSIYNEYLMWKRIGRCMYYVRME